MATRILQISVVSLCVINFNKFYVSAELCWNNTRFYPWSCFTGVFSEGQIHCQSRYKSLHISRSYWQYQLCMKMQCVSHQKGQYVQTDKQPFAVFKVHLKTASLSSIRNRIISWKFVISFNLPFTVFIWGLSACPPVSFVYLSVCVLNALRRSFC